MTDKEKLEHVILFLEKHVEEHMVWMAEQMEEIRLERDARNQEKNKTEA